MSAKPIIPVLAGGGTRLPAHVGILTALEQMGYSMQQLVGVSGWDPFFGYGWVDALAALQLAAGVETSDKVAPETAIVSPGTIDPAIECFHAA